MQELPTVLMIEDDSEFAGDMTVILRGKAKVIHVCNTAEASAHLMRSLPDLLWIDLDLPPFFGLDRAREGLEFLRALHERIKVEFPIIVVSADLRSPGLEGLKEFPTVRTLSKPPEPAQLYMSMSAILRHIEMK